MTKTTKSKAPSQPASTVQAIPSNAPAPAPTKRDIVLGLLARPEGASLDEMVAATGWLPHTTRAMLTGLKKKDHVLSSEKVDGVRRYRATKAS
jgi:hypothetical protein